MSVRPSGPARSSRSASSMGVSSASDRRWDGAPCGQVSFGDALWWAASGDHVSGAGPGLQQVRVRWGTAGTPGRTIAAGTPWPARGYQTWVTSVRWPRYARRRAHRRDTWPVPSSRPVPRRMDQGLLRRPGSARPYSGDPAARCPPPAVTRTPFLLHPPVAAAGSPVRVSAVRTHRPPGPDGGRTPQTTPASEATGWKQTSVSPASRSACCQNSGEALFYGRNMKRAPAAAEPAP